jgi:hypothetical protein
VRRWKRPTDPDYILFTQPESLVLFERFDSGQSGLGTQVPNATLQAWVSCLGSAWRSSDLRREEP